MKTYKLLIGILMPSLFSAAPLGAQSSLSDPYEIMLMNKEAVGGLDKLKAETSSYVEADISLGGLQGTVKTWSQYPIYQRQDLDLKVFKSTSGDNGTDRWSVDANGQAQFLRDEEQIKRRELAKLNADYDYLDRNSATFELEYRGVTQVGEADCYSVLTKNTINNDSTLTFINKTTFMVEKETSYTPDEETHTLFTDYRRINGILRSFHQEITTLPVNQEVSVQVTRYEVNIETNARIFEPDGEDRRDFRFVSGDRIEDVPFEYILDHIFVPVTLGCKERSWFLDTGAGMTVIDSSFAAELGLTFEGELTGQGTGNTVSFSFVKLPPMSLKGIEIDEQTVASIDIRSILQKAGLKAVGILGYDFISRFVIKVDYANRTLSLYDPDTFEYDGTGVALAAPLVGNNMTVRATVDGTYTGNWQLDMGAGGNSFHYPFANSNGFLERGGIENISFGAGGELYVKDLKFKGFEIGGHVVDNPVFAIPQKATAGAFGGGDLIGNIGNSFLRHFTLYLNYSKQELIVERGGDFSRTFPPPKSGLQIMFDSDSNYEIINVSSNTPAESSGFEAGDKLLSINGIAVENFKGLESIGDLMSAPAGTRYTAVVLRGNVEKELTLELRDIY